MTIKTRINLYSESLLPVELRLSFNRMFIGLIVMLVCSLVSATVNYVFVLGLESEYKELASKKNILVQDKKSLEEKIAQHSPDMKLVAKIDLMTQQIEFKIILLGELSQREEFTSRGYSSLMKDLAQVANTSIWLNRFQVDSDNYVFEGFTAAPHSVPLWIDRLKMTDTLKGQTFASMTMSRGEDQPLSFTLTSISGSEGSQ